MVAGHCLGILVDGDDGFAIQFRLRCLIFPARFSAAIWAAVIAAVIKQVRGTFMEKKYGDITKRISGDLRKLRQDIPDTVRPSRRWRRRLVATEPWTRRPKN